MSRLQLRTEAAAFSCLSFKDTLQATGRCGTGKDAVKSASCGFSYKYSELNGRCLQFFENELYFIAPNEDEIEE